MSYARWGWDNSDVYVFLTKYDDEYVIQCCGCFLSEQSENLKTPAEAVEHFESHRQAGHMVVQSTIDDILTDYPEMTVSFTEQEKKNDSI